MKLTTEEVYDKIVDWNKRLKQEFKHDSYVKIKSTMGGISELFEDVSPEEMAVHLRRLMKDSKINSNIDDEGVYPLDAYVLPSYFP